MIDASAYDMEENIARTNKVVELCHAQGVAVEGELGHVGVAANLDNLDTSVYTKPEDAVHFVNETHVDSLAIACGTAHGAYPKGFVPTLSFDVIRNVRAAVDVPLALHGTSGAGEENIRKAVEAGINKVNIATEIFAYIRDHTKQMLEENPDYDFLQLQIDIEEKAKEITRHFIQVIGTTGKAKYFSKSYKYEGEIGQIVTDEGE